MLKIRIETIPHDRHRYPTVGDYWDDPDGTLQLRVTDLGDRRLELLIALHELIECELCRQRGIAEPDIMAFDMAFEKEIEAGDRDNEDEPGDDPRAPYHREHIYATNIERMLAYEMGVNWDEYGERLDELYAERNDT